MRPEFQQDIKTIDPKTTPSDLKRLRIFDKPARKYAYKHFGLTNANCYNNNRREDLYMAACLAELLVEFMLRHRSQKKQLLLQVPDISGKDLKRLLKLTDMSLKLRRAQYHLFDELSDGLVPQR